MTDQQATLPEPERPDEREMCGTCGVRPVLWPWRFRCDECVQRASDAVAAAHPGDGPIILTDDDVPF